ncbi:hypothetical protein FRC03_011359 [Tulasnella sp. 419]|nr:hypothetical protein FRC03_011359 [Tulasnella sp. 419]
MKLFTICLFVFYISHVGVQALVIPHHRSGRSDAISHLGSRILDSYNSTKQWFRRKVWGREDVPNMRCNGVENFCTRSYGNITFIGSHNFFAVSKNPLVLSANQNVDVIDQLNLGVRLLQGQVHLEGDKMKLCHTHCVGKLLYDGGLLVDQLRKVKTWLDAHPQEVLTFIFTNPDRVDLRKYWKPQFVDSGLESMMYRPHSGSTHRDSWPTLGELISSGRRVIAFLDYRANTTEVDYLLPEFDNIWETPFSITEAQTLETCKVHRVNGNPVSR